MMISGVYAGSQISRANMPRAKVGSEAVSLSPVDTVSISEEAMAAYRNSKASVADIRPSEEGAGVASSEGKELESALIAWFKNVFSGSDQTISGDVAFETGGGELLPENREFRAILEEKIDEINGASRSPFAVAPKEILDEMQPFRQKLNALSALGDKMVLTDDILEKAASFLQNLEDEWREARNISDGSPRSQLRAVLDGTATVLSDRLTEEERVRIMEEKAVEEMNGN